MIKRRSMLVGGIALIGGWVGIRFATTTDANAIVTILRKKLNYLKMDQAGLEAFARDLASRHQLATGRLRLVEVAGPLYRDISYSGDNILSKSLRHGEERVVTLYLMSSDFFVNGADVSKVVRYLGYYDPLRACADPFARRVTSG